MPFTTGTATDYRDLLDKLHTYLLAQAWTVDDFALGATITDPSHLYLTAPGNVGGQQPRIAILTDCDTVANAYAWKVTAYPNYNSALAFGLQEDCSPISFFSLWANTIDYWFYVNDTRLIVIAKLGTYYLSMYAGFFLPYTLPDEYPYPYFVGATYRNLQVYNYADASMRAFCDPGYMSASYMRRDGLDWGLFSNNQVAFNTEDSYWINEGPVMWPYRNPTVNPDALNTDIAWSFFHQMRAPIGGKMPLWQCTIIDPVDAVIAGVLDGVFAIGGFNRAPEQVVTVGAQDYRLFINVGRNSPKHYFAIEEV